MKSTNWQMIGLGIFLLASCTTLQPSAKLEDQTVAETLSRAMSADGHYISWKEHIIDAEDVNGGVAIRGGDGLAIGDVDHDGYVDVVTAQEDSNHLRIAFGTSDPSKWTNRTLAQGATVAAIEDIAIGDFNGDGWLDLVVACEDAHLAYFQNPGNRDQIRNGSWESIIPASLTGRGSWLRVFSADVNGDGRLDLTAANKGAADLVREGDAAIGSGATSLITFNGPPLQPQSWSEQVLFKVGVPNNAMPIDIDKDGDIDVLAAKRVAQEIIIVENLGANADGTIEVAHHPISLTPAFEASSQWHGRTNAFQADSADLNSDGRVDLVLRVVEFDDSKLLSWGLGWIEQPDNLSKPWQYHRIGDMHPDWPTGIKLADIDGDGDLDVLTGGYSGLNILAGAYSGASRDYDDPTVTASSTVGRLAWFENTGDGTTWERHDISRRVRGMYDMFEARDMDGDGDLDFIAPRGNSGNFDGAVWLEQVRSEVPQPSFLPARRAESRHLPLPPSNWREFYSSTQTDIAPNKENGPVKANTHD